MRRTELNKLLNAHGIAHNPNTPAVDLAKLVMDHGININTGKAPEQKVSFVEKPKIITLTETELNGLTFISLKNLAKVKGFKSGRGDTREQLLSRFFDG
ncbi:MAG: hypothetical protein ACE5DX_05840 [Candidatus Dojkabacteria bacterium]